MEIKDITHGFEVVNIRPAKEEESELIEMRHLKTGASLIWMKNDEDNKLFSIAFKTTPVDDTGVFHILEHSVLNGSKKYPVKEPFVELIKSSMNTFLNAMTFPDKTVYPVSSRNEKDFENLMSVYLDAVFYPAIYTNPNIFYQEGWHHEIRNKEDDVVFKGVVYNEMKGAFSSADTLIVNELTRIMYPDTCYGFVSGGDPKAIPDLTYENFINTHKHYYHPSNAIIYLDGNLNIERTLQKINDEYLTNFERDDKEITIDKQVRVKPKDTTIEFEVSEIEPDQSILCLGNYMGDFDEKKKIGALDIIATYLFGTNESVAKKALLESGLCQDAEMETYNGIYNPFVITVFRNIADGKEKEVKAKYKEILRNVVANGVEKEELEAIINQIEFKEKESTEPKALYRNFSVLDSMLYGGDPMLYLESEAVYKELRSDIETGYFENLIKELLLEDEHECSVLAMPSTVKGQKDAEEEALRASTRKASWSDKELTDYIEINNKLDLWQKTPDTKEDLDKLPSLDLKEVSETPILYSTEEKEVNGVRVLYHKERTSNIVYLSMYFKMNDVKEEDLTTLCLMTNAFQFLPTKNHDVSELQRIIRRDFGGLSFEISPMPTKDLKTTNILLTVRAAFLKENADKCADIVLDILFNTIWDSKSKINEIIKQAYEGSKNMITNAGHQIAIRRSTAKLQLDNYVKDKFDGYEGYLYLKEFNKDFDNYYNNYLEVVDKCNKRLGTKRLIVSITSDSYYDPSAYLKMPEGLESPDEFKCELLKDEGNEAIEVPSLVNYISSAYSMKEYGFEPNQGLKVLGKILSYSYLWNEVRVKGGAYGTGVTFTDRGVAFTYSYRDPNGKETIEAYDGQANFIEEFINSDEELEKYIISTIGDLEPLVSPATKGRTADVEWFRHLTDEIKIAHRKELLSLTKEDLNNYVDMLKSFKENKCICAVANKNTIDDLHELVKVRRSI